MSDERNSGELHSAGIAANVFSFLPLVMVGRDGIFKNNQCPGLGQGQSGTLIIFKIVCRPILLSGHRPAHHRRIARRTATPPAARRLAMPPA